MTDRVGDKIGNYQLVRLLGEGGFAEVYLAEHTFLGTSAAIKLLYVRVAAEDLAQFQQEGRMLAALEHPSIVRVLDFGIENRTPYLIMNYAPGGTLRSRHPKGSRVPLPTVVEYVKQVAQALQHAHDHKFIHRDIKPENMLISRDGTLLLSDFGIAVISCSQRTSFDSQAGTSGTPYYMAPELFAGRPRTASDQYSLGVVVYEWLCGTLPFAEGNAIQLGFQHTYQPVPPLREQLPTLSPAVEQVVLRALAKKPEERFGSIGAFATALEQASLPAPVQLPRPLILPPAQSPTNVIPVVQRRPVPPAAVPAAPQGTLLVTYRGHSGLVRGVAWSPDGTRIASGSWDKTVQVWNARNGSQPFTYHGHGYEVYSVSWSPDGTRISSSSGEGTVQVWNARDGSQPFTYRGHRGSVFSVAWSPDGTRIASGSNDHTVQVWSARNGSQPFTYRVHSDSVWSVAWSPDSTRIVSGSSDKTVQVWNAGDGSQLFTYRGHSGTGTSVAWSPDGMRIASYSTDNTVQVWDARDGKQLFTCRGPTNSVWAVAWSPDGTRLASSSQDNTVQVWDARDGKQLFTCRGHSARVYSVAWSPDGTRLASGSEDNTVQVWQAV